MSCQQKPTLGVTDSGVLVENKDYRKMIREDAVIFDTRSAFDFNMSKVPGSVNLPVRDFESSKDPLDSARRLSLYGINPKTPVVIIGEGKGDEQKLAWEFVKLGITQIDTLKTSVFRLLNIQPEPTKKNATIWKPENQFGELNQKQFDKKIESLQPKMTSKAQSASYQGFPIGQALRKRTLVLTTSKDWAQRNKYLFADHEQVSLENLYDDNGLLNRNQFNKLNNVKLKNYDAVFLIDSTSESAAHAYAIVAAGAKSLFLVH
jgi:rhodanese-related sulfurtransferase